MEAQYLGRREWYRAWDGKKMSVTQWIAWGLTWEIPDNDDTKNIDKGLKPGDLVQISWSIVKK